MVRWLLALLGLAAGTALGLFAPVGVLVALGLGSGSYEDVLPLWLATIPGGALAGAWAGWRGGGALSRHGDVPR